MFKKFDIIRMRENTSMAKNEFDNMNTLYVVTETSFGYVTVDRLNFDYRKLSFPIEEMEAAVTPRNNSTTATYEHDHEHEHDSYSIYTILFEAFRQMVEDNPDITSSDVARMMFELTFLNESYATYTTSNLYPYALLLEKMGLKWRRENFVYHVNSIIP